MQGSAADVAKCAMLALHARLPCEDARLVNMVHDELLLEVRADRLQRVGKWDRGHGMEADAFGTAGRLVNNLPPFCLATPHCCSAPLPPPPDQVAALVRDAMEGAAPEVTVPLRVQLRAGPTWGDLQPLELQPLPESEDVLGASQAGGPVPMDAVAPQQAQQQAQQV